MFLPENTKDYSDLQDATDKFCSACDEFDTSLKHETTCFLELKEKEQEVRKGAWSKLLSGEITKGVYEEIIKNDTFQEKLNWESAKLSRRLVENKKDSLQERLYTIKKLYSII